MIEGQAGINRRGERTRAVSTETSLNGRAFEGLTSPLSDVEQSEEAKGWMRHTASGAPDACSADVLMSLG